jgi:8-oxo-dGTP pyrophosphatase MutT (NUDIX family)
MTDWVRQAAVIAMLDGCICLVTSRNGRRWVLPKGLIDLGHTAGEAALVEAWEEAGLVGVLAPEPVGAYVYEKLGQEHHVLLFRMTATEARDNWPERGFRQRAWVTPDVAIDRIEEPGLRDVLRQLFRIEHPDRIAVA